MSAAQPHIQFLTQNRPGSSMGMGHFERLLFDLLDKHAPAAWSFGVTFSGRAPATEAEREVLLSQLPPRMRGVSYLGFSHERLANCPWPLSQNTLRMALRTIRRKQQPDLWVSLSLSFPAPYQNSLYFVHDLPSARFDDEGTLPVWAPQAGVAARAILTPSQFAKDELVELLGLQPEKIHPLLHGCEHEVFNPQVNPASQERLNSLGIKRPFLIYAGGCSQRKNVPALLQAWKSLAPEFPELNLILVGPREGLQRIADDTAAPRVTIAGYLDRSVLPSVIKASEALVCPSIYEGFGLPPLEAIALGVPVVATKAGAIPEVLADCAVYAADGSAENLTSAMRTLLNDSDLQNSLKHRGPLRAQQLSWTDNIARTIELYKKYM